MLVIPESFMPRLLALDSIFEREAASSRSFLGRSLQLVLEPKYFGVLRGNLAFGGVLRGDSGVEQFLAFRCLGDQRTVLFLHLHGNLRGDFVLNVVNENLFHAVSSLFRLQTVEVDLGLWPHAPSVNDGHVVINAVDLAVRERLSVVCSGFFNDFSGTPHADGVEAVFNSVDTFALCDGKRDDEVFPVDFVTLAGSSDLEIADGVDVEKSVISIVLWRVPDNDGFEESRSDACFCEHVGWMAE